MQLARGWLLKASVALNVVVVVLWLSRGHRRDDDFGDGVEEEEEATRRRSRRLKELVECFDAPAGFKVAQRGAYWVLLNYVPAARRRLRCHEGVTFTTHCDHTYLGNLAALVDRWRAPVSLALYAPGDDFPAACDAVVYARSCLSPLVAEFVTFHVFFDSGQLPGAVPSPEDMLSRAANCSAPAPWEETAETHRRRGEIPYPVNVARNVAREASSTHFVLAADVELYPSPGLADGFLDLVLRRGGHSSSPSGPEVFPLALFELQEGAALPGSKTELLAMLSNGSAAPFHEKLCHDCHNLPNARRWRGTPEEPRTRVLNVGRRTDRYRHWEPVFLGTRDDPLYDERLTWEGMRDKMTQGYIMCVKRYRFLILNNPFLVHTPGIKRKVVDARRSEAIEHTNALIDNVILPELKLLFGSDAKCSV
ncbi:beta-1,4-glucuronyltransferase 1-like [Bacillus rossius redtenbacheri]|uniref:beta-1,4-glucuronyltransferase 1-like n=1 Tax=Bacillus rossius redtenbacheri TaxID=93214 RepID=UPI002FDE45AF